MKKSLTNLILLSLEKSIDGYIRLEDFLYNTGCYAYGSGWEYPLKKADLAQAFKRLRERGLIEFVSDQELEYRLTDKGKQKAVWEALSADKREWDGKWRLVIFDIPEKRRQARNLLRGSLKKWGFVHWQKSVWASKKDCLKPLWNFIKSVGIEDWVIVLESDHVSLY